MPVDNSGKSASESKGAGGVKVEWTEMGEWTLDTIKAVTAMHTCLHTHKAETDVGTLT